MELDLGLIDLHFHDQPEEAAALRRLLQVFPEAGPEVLALVFERETGRMAAGPTDASVAAGDRVSPARAIVLNAIPQ